MMNFESKPLKIGDIVTITNPFAIHRRVLKPGTRAEIVTLKPHITVKVANLKFNPIIFAEEII